MRLLLIFFSLVLLCPARGQDHLALAKIRIPVAERGAIPGYALAFGSNRLKFIPPAATPLVRLDPATDSVWVEPRDLRFQISFTILTNFAASTSSQLLARATNGLLAPIVFGTGFAFSGSGKAPYLEVALTQEGDPWSRKVVFQRFGDHILQVTLSAPAPEYPKATGIFAQILTSVQNLAALPP
jgi:hypothetical protein